MALCFAHAAAGYLAYEAVRPAGASRAGWLAAAVLLANAPDLDFVPGLVLGTPGAYHRGVSHTVLAAVIAGLAVAAGAFIREQGARAWRIGAWAAAVYGSHLLVDLFTADARAPHGAPFLWPFSDEYYIAPVTPLGEILIDASGRRAFLASLVAPETFAAWLADASWLVAIVAGVHVLRVLSPRFRREAAPSPP